VKITLSLRILFCVIFLEFILLLSMVMLSPPKPIWDESAYLASIPLLWKYGFSRHYLLNLPFCGGPLFAVIHTLFSPLTSIELPMARGVSIFFLFIIIVCIAQTLRMLNYSRPFKYAFLIMGLPPMYVVSALALSDILGMAFCITAIALTLYGIKTYDYKGWIASLVAGFCWAAALLTRQIYLPALLALVLFVFKDRRLWLKIALSMSVGIIPFLYIVFIWGGLTCPSGMQINRGFSFSHFLSALAFTGIFISILCPEWFKIRLAVLIVIAMLCVFISSFWHLFSGIIPMKIVTSHLFSDSALKIPLLLVPGAYLTLAVITIFGFLRRAWENRNDIVYLYFVFAVVGILLTQIKVTSQFSSRYAIAVAPLLIILLVRQIKFNISLVLRVLIGGTLGILSLSGYIFFK